MSEEDNFAHVQRRLTAVIAKSEWTSSRMRMQKSGEELRESRAKSNRTANKFLQELLDKRTDSDLIDDNGAVDRYNKFVKYKSVLNDDTNNTLDEFDRRLRALNNNRRNQPIKLNNENVEKKQQQDKNPIKNDLQSTIEVQHDKKEIVNKDERPKPSRILPSISTIPITSTPNDTTHELLTPVFHDDDVQELSNVQSANISLIDSQTNHVESSIDQHHSLSLEESETLNSSTSSITQTLYTPKARRPDGTEIVFSSSSSSSRSPVPHASSNVVLFNHCYLPRSLTSRGKLNSNPISKRQLPSLPLLQTSEQKQVQSEQYDTNQLYHFLDHLDNDFKNRLDQLTLSTIIHNNQDEINENISLITNNDDDDDEGEHILPNLFDPSSSSVQEKLFYTTLTINMDDSKDLVLYTMTLSTVQLSASILLPYSVLNGRRPSVKCSSQTRFKQIRSKREKYTCQVTAIESSSNIEQLKQNDIILKINDQSVWRLTTNEIIDIFKRSNTCSLTIARLCQPFI